MTRNGLVGGILVLLALCGLAWQLVRDGGVGRASIESREGMSVAADESAIALGAADLANAARDDALVAGEPNSARDLPIPVADIPDLEVRIIARVESNGSQRPAPGVVLEVGAARWSYALGAPWVTLVTDADGRGHASLRGSALAEFVGARRPVLWVRGSGTGLLTHTETLPLRDRRDEPTEIEITVQPGAVVAGLVRGPDGEPACGRLWVRNVADGLPAVFGERTRSDGRFEVELREEGTWVVLARGTSDPEQVGDFDLGTGVSDRFVVHFDQPTPFVEVRVFGPGVIRGRVFGEGEEPSAGLELVVSLAEDVSLAGIERVQDAAGGNASVTTVTDADGAFEVRGLRDALYVVDAQVFGQRGLSERRRLTQRPEPADGRAFVLRLARPHLAIHVRQADSEPLDEDIPQHVGSTDSTWPDAAGLFVIRAPDDPRSGDWPFLSTQRVGRGEFVTDIEEGSIVDVGLLGGALPWTSRRVSVPAGAGRLDVDLRLPPPVEKGTLALDIVDGTGTPVVKALRARVFDPGSGVVLVDEPFFLSESGPWPRRLDLPEGEYSLLVEGQAVIGSLHGAVLDRRSHGAFASSLSIVAGRETPVRAVLGAGARLHVRLVGEPHEIDREAGLAALLESGPLIGADTPEEVAAEWASNVTLRLECPGHQGQPVEFMNADIESLFYSFGRSLRSTLDFGEQATSEVLSPGKCTLVARTRGGRIVRRPITLVDGETLDVTLAFD